MHAAISKSPLEKRMHISHVQISCALPTVQTSASVFEVLSFLTVHTSPASRAVLIPKFRAGKHLSVLPLEPGQAAKICLSLEGEEVRHEIEPK